MGVNIIDDQKNVEINAESQLAQVQQKPSLSKFYQVPKEFVKIPSKGKIYPKESGLMNEEIEMRYMTAADEDDLTSPSLIRKGIWLTRLLQNCMVNKNFSSEDLLVGDRNALLFWLRQSAYGILYNLAINCVNPNCNKKFENEFKLDRLTMKTLDLIPITEGKNEFLFVLPKSNLKVIFSLMTGKMSQELDKEFEAQTNSKMPKEQVVTARLKKQIIEIEGIRDTQEISGFIDKGMLATDSLALRNYIDENTPDIILKQNAVCPHCGTANDFDIPIEIQFFWPQPRT